jgi:DNA-binding transcriptional MerR regulator
MKVSELSDRADVPLPTIKFYIREGLLPKGASTGKNQADYGVVHLERLALIRSLKEDAGLGIDAIGRVLRAADSAREEYIRVAIDAVAGPGTADFPESPEYAQNRESLVELAQARGWEVSGDDVSVREAARHLVTISHAFPDKIGGSLEPYFDAVETIARYEIPQDFAGEVRDEGALRYALLGTLLFEPFILALRRMAHVAHSRAARKRVNEARKVKRK